MKHFIPGNLDIDELCRRFPPSEIQNFSKDKLIHILHLLYAIPATNKDLEIRDGFVPIYSNILQRRIHNYKDYISYLLTAGVLETDNKYIPGLKSKGYRFAADYRTFFVPVEITDSSLRRHCRRERAFAGNMKKKYRHLMKWFDEDLKIDRNLALEFVQTDYERKMAEPTLRDPLPKHEGYKDPYTQLTCASLNVERIADAEFILHVDQNVGRFHSNLTNLRSDLRHCLTYGCENLVSIDIKNSQPYLSIILLNHQFWSNINPIISTIIKQVYNTKDKYSSFIMSVNTALSQARPDLQRFVDVVTQGCFYEYLAEQLGRELGISYSSRKRVKEAVFQVLFTDNRFFGQPGASPKRAFRNFFPSVYEVFSIIKGADKTLLPRILQRIESHLILHEVSKRIASERPLLPIFTIHDSIATTCGNEEYVQRVMREELYKATGYLPKLAVEPWHPSLLKFKDGLLFGGEEMVA